MTPWEFILMGLATWRTASLLVREAGPFHVFRKIRELAGITHDDGGQVLSIPDGLFAGILSCIWCCSIWTAFAWLLIWLAWGDIGALFAIPFALSTLAICVDKLLE